MTGHQQDLSGLNFHEHREYISVDAWLPLAQQAEPPHLLQELGSNGLESRATAPNALAAQAYALKHEIQLTVYSRNSTCYAVLAPKMPRIARRAKEWFHEIED